MEEAYQVEIPCYFLCPISMQLMRDPVTISTGITYDRENIEKWLFSCKNKTCPVTKQVLFDTDLTPNHTLRRLIQAWCTVNAFERIPTPKPPVDRSQILKLLNEAKNSPNSQLSCLQRIRSIAHRNESSKNHLQAAGTVDFLLSIVRKNEDAMSRDEALNILQEMELSDSDLKTFFSDDGGILDSLIQVLESGNCKNRVQAITLLKSAFDIADPAHLIGSKPEIFTQTVRILRDEISQQATKAALKLLLELCPWGRNRIKAVGSGAVSALVELLLETADRRCCELVLTVLDQLCSGAEGRAELLRHGAGLAVVSKKILRVSHVASDRAVRILSLISKYSSNSRVLQEMLQVGVVSKLCLVLQLESSQKTKERAKEILRLHSRVWKDSSCIPSHLLSSYPSS
ncbi:hypothetical protein Pfo_017907 [Paulownia fortunei]|nr:hypothetical protein Pfo_017907 [Paulownia fortunei]